MPHKRTQKGRPKLSRILVIWEPVPGPDPAALLKAVAMMFNRDPGPALRQLDEERKAGAHSAQSEDCG